MSRKYNKGEWAEFYAFSKILESGRLYAADEDMQKIPEIYYTILSAIKNDIEYHRNNDKDSVTFKINNQIISIPISEFEIVNNKLFPTIKSSSSTFTIPELNSFIDKLSLDSIKENNQSKGDISLKIHDDYTGYEPTLSFSIKSYVGSNPTLLNASNGTVITYETSGNLTEANIAEINSIEGRGKIINRINRIKELGSKLNYKNINATIFKENLQMIDYRLPIIISEIFLESYFVRGKKIPDVVDSYLNKNPDENPRIIKYKIKEFLVAIALGMVPLTEWSGLDEANGGYIVVKDDSEVLCYHIYERNKLKQYLYNNTKFDTPSTGRTNAGLLLKNERDNSIEFNLTMQIRF